MAIRRFITFIIDTFNIKDKAVTSAKIADGAISDIHVSATAAIADTKINPVPTTQLNTHKTAAILDHPDGSVTTLKIANAAVTTAKLKFATGSWATGITSATGGVSVINLVEYSHYPKIWKDNVVYKVILFDGSIVAEVTNTATYQIWAYLETSGYNWYGNYTYHSASEQIIEEYYDPVSGEIIGVHVTEAGNENSMHWYDTKGNSISAKRVIRRANTDPDLFDADKQCKHNAEQLFNMRKGKKHG